MKRKVGGNLNANEHTEHIVLFTEVSVENLQQIIPNLRGVPQSTVEARPRAKPTKVEVIAVLAGWLPKQLRFVRFLWTLSAINTTGTIDRSTLAIGDNLFCPIYSDGTLDRSQLTEDGFEDRLLRL